MASNFQNYWNKIQLLLNRKGLAAFPTTLTVVELGLLTPVEVSELQNRLQNAYEVVKITPQVGTDNYNQRLVNGYEIEIRPFTNREQLRQKNAEKTLQDLEAYIRQNYNFSVGWLVIPEDLFPNVGASAPRLECVFRQEYPYVHISWAYGRHSWQGKSLTGNWYEVRISDQPLKPIP